VSFRRIALKPVSGGAGPGEHFECPPPGLPAAAPRGSVAVTGEEANPERRFLQRRSIQSGRRFKWPSRRFPVAAVPADALDSMSRIPSSTMDSSSGSIGKRRQA
jgi:hypothetical protein